MSKNIAINITLSLVLLFSSVSISYAWSSNGGYGNVICNPTYGGGNECNPAYKVTINKTVANPSTGDMVDNLTVNDPKYSPDSVVTFQIIVTNTGNTDIDKVTVQDIFPQYVRFNSGAGNYDSEKKTLSFDVTNLKAGESKSYTVTGKTASADEMPADKAITCVTNQSVVYFKGMSMQDNASFCIQKQVVTSKGGLTVYPAPKLTATPGTGPESLPIIGFIFSAISGFFLRKNQDKFLRKKTNK